MTRDHRETITCNSVGLATPHLLINLVRHPAISTEQSVKVKNERVGLKFESELIIISEVLEIKSSAHCVY